MFDKEVKVRIGETEIGKCVSTNVDILGNVFILGLTGSGKSVLINTLIENVISDNDQHLFRLCYIHPFSKYFFKADKKYLLNDKGLASTKKDIKKLLKILWKEIKRRKSNQIFPKILVFCDESSELKTFVKKFEKLLKYGQNVGVYFIFASQLISWFSEGALKNINSKILFRMFDGRTADEFIRTGEATKLKMGEYFYKCRNWDIVKCKPVNFIAKR